VALRASPSTEDGNESQYSPADGAYTEMPPLWRTIVPFARTWTHWTRGSYALGAWPPRSLALAAVAALLAFVAFVAFVAVSAVVAWPAVVAVAAVVALFALSAVVA
jgi:hypothetical protein